MTETGYAPKTCRTRICIISDTHCTEPRLPKSDILIHCGDLTHNGMYEQLRGQAEMLRAAPAELKLVIAGNHDITLDPVYYARRGVMMHGEGKLQDLKACRELFVGEESQKASVRYLDEGLSQHRLPSSGARFTVYASPYQPEFCDWAFPYQRHEDRFNVPKLGDAFIAENPVPDFPQCDLMITHGPPAKVLDHTWRGPDAGCDNLMRALKRCRPQLHCFGHIHEARGTARMLWDANQAAPEEVRLRANAKESQDVQQEGEATFSYLDVSQSGPKPIAHGNETLFINASIMNVRYKPTNRPWVVDIDLPVAEFP